MVERHFDEQLQAAVARHLGAGCTVRDLQRLTGGAASITWKFTVEGDASKTLILRLSQGGAQISTGIDKQTEASVLQAVAGTRVPAPEVAFVLDAEDGLGEGFAMEFVAGESIPRRILRDDAFADARAAMTSQCGEILATIHGIDGSSVPMLPDLDAGAQLSEYESIYRGFGERSPVFELAFRWLGRHLPRSPAQGLVHGDFRNGNFLVDPGDGIVAVLDWELAHRGDPMEDLGWLCVNSWRFGRRENAVGGFGRRRDLFAAYEAASGMAVDPEHVRFWEIFGSLRWGVICLYLTFEYLNGAERSVELAAIGRRVSETEIDLLQLL